MRSQLTNDLRIRKLQVLTQIKLLEANNKNNRVNVYRQYKLTLPKQVITGFIDWHSLDKLPEFPMVKDLFSKEIVRFFISLKKTSIYFASLPAFIKQSIPEKRVKYIPLTVPDP